MVAALAAERTRELERKLAECKQMDEALRESENRYRSLVEESADIMGVLQEGRLVFVNSTGARQVGAKNRGEIVGRKGEDFIHPDDLPAALARIQRLLAGETGMYPAEVRYMCLDGTTLPVEVSATHTIFGAKPSVQFTARDITKRKWLQEALLSESEFNRLVIENAGQGICVCHEIQEFPHVRFTVWNDHMALITGYSLEEINRLGWYQSMHHDRPVQERAIMRMRSMRVGDKLPGEEWEITRADGQKRQLLITTRVYAGTKGESCALAVMDDITERRRAEVEKAKLEAELQQVRKMEVVGRLAGGVAHDFNNMVQVILGNVDLAMEANSPGSPVFESLEEIQKAARRSADLTQQLLTFARRQTIAPKVVDLNETVEALLKMLRRLIGEDIHLAWLPAPGLGSVKVAPSQIDQILANLCVNARDAIGGVGKITIETDSTAFDDAYCADHVGAVPGEYVRLAVSDEGCGMDKETLAHIFEPFFTTKGVGEGTGLGLAMVYGIVAQNHGFIQVRSEPGKGATFSIYLPQHAGQAAATGTEDAAKLPKSRGETVLLVEEELALLGIARRVLERLGYTVLSASTPSEAIRLAEAHPKEIHLLMTNVLMPEMNGRDLAKRLVSDCPALKCLFMSGYPADAIAHHGVLDEGMHFIPKPFSVEDLAAKVREVLEQE